MRKIVLLLGCLLFSCAVCAQGAFLNTKVKDIRGITKSVSEYVAPKGLTVFVFWKTCCPNNLAMLGYLQESIEDAGGVGPLTFVLVSVDDGRSVGRVRPVVGSFGWEEEVLLDTNREFARQVNVILPPQWLVVNPEGKEVFRCKITSSHTDVGIYLNQIEQLIK